jgi:hypothetical protein
MGGAYFFYDFPLGIGIGIALDREDQGASFKPNSDFLFKKVFPKARFFWPRFTVRGRAVNHAHRPYNNIYITQVHFKPSSVILIIL